jgi:hypothetical protein
LAFPATHFQAGAESAQSSMLHPSIRKGLSTA